MPIGWLNPADDVDATATRPSSTLGGSGVQKWFSDTLQTFIRAQDFNAIVACLRYCMTQAGISDVEGDDTILYQSILAFGRQKLSADTTYYVRTDGNDLNNGLANTPTGAFLTIQAAVNTAASKDCQGHNVTIQVADGTYNQSADCRIPSMTGLGSATFLIQGNVATPANCIINNTAGSSFNFLFGSIATIQGFKVQGSAVNSYGIACQIDSQINIGAMEYGACGSNVAHIYASVMSVVYINASYTVSGGANYHIQSQRNSRVQFNGAWTITLTGTPNFGTAYYYVEEMSTLFLYANLVYSGSATGVRYVVMGKGAIRFNQLWGIDIDLLATPGDTPGKYQADAFVYEQANRNLLINPNGRIQTGPSGTRTNVQFTLHNRWYFLGSSTGAITPSTTTDVLQGFPYMMRLLNGATSQKNGYAQIIEGVNCKHLRGRRVCLNGYVRGNQTAQVRYYILSWNGTQDAPTRNVVANWADTTYSAGNFFAAGFVIVGFVAASIAANDTIQPIAGNASVAQGIVPIDCNNLTVFAFTTYNMTATTGYLELWLQLEEGEYASRRETRPYEVENRMCERYFQSKTVYTTNGVRWIPFTKMRAVPTVVTALGTAANATADGFELTHTATASSVVTADCELGV